METKPRAVVLVLLSTLFTSSGQIFLKEGSNQLVLGFFALMANSPLIVGCVLYGLGAVMLIVSLKYGELSVLYPLYALNFIWVSILSPWFFPDSMNTLKWFGVLLVIVGVSFIGLGSRSRK
jgi:multidrug transporter EmrE-like cation transporter